MPRAKLDPIDGYGTFFFIENPALLQEKAGTFLRLHAAGTPTP